MKDDICPHKTGVEQGQVLAPMHGSVQFEMEDHLGDVRLSSLRLSSESGVNTDKILNRFISFDGLWLNGFSPSERSSV